MELARGKRIPDACKKIRVTEQTYYRWKKKEHGGLRMDLAKRLENLEKENLEKENLEKENLEKENLEKENIGRRT